MSHTADDAFFGGRLAAVLSLPDSSPDGGGLWHRGENVGFIKEFWLFLKVRKKFWLLPILLVAALFGGMLVVTEGSAAAPFIYTLF